MQELNRRAMSIPREDLLKELEEAIHHKALLLKERDRRYGMDRVRIHSYGENLYLPETFGFDMRDYYQDPELALDIELRSRIFWLDNSHDDANTSLDIHLPVSMYFDMTFFGLQIHYTRDGVPNMAPHPLSEKADLSLLKPFDFKTSGDALGVEAVGGLPPAFRGALRRKTELHFPSFPPGTTGSVCAAAGI